MICYYLIRWSQCQQHLKIVNSRVFWQTMFDYKRVLLCPSLKRDDDIQSLRFCNESKAPTIWCNGTPVITILYYIYIKFIHQKNGTTTLFKLNIIENKIKTLDSPALWSWCPARRKKTYPALGPRNGPPYRRWWDSNGVRNWAKAIENCPVIPSAGIQLQQHLPQIKRWKMAPS